MKKQPDVYYNEVINRYAELEVNQLYNRNYRELIYYYCVQFGDICNKTINQVNSDIRFRMEYYKIELNLRKTKEESV